jgi:branched-chain amino acid transport system ATP-binding protein
MNIIELKNIYASYGKKEVLSDVSIEVKKGEIVSLIGPNGAGKSTTLKVISGFLKPKSGKIIFKDKDVTNLSPWQRSKLGIAYLFQGGSIFENLTVIENLKLSNEKIETAFEIFPELEKYKKTRAGLLSGGLKQMLSISLILLKDPDLLLFDEPSAGLSPALVEKLISKIKDINQKFNKTILLVEQNIVQALKISNRLYLMSAGKIIKESDDPLTFPETEKFEKIFFET